MSDTSTYSGLPIPTYAEDPDFPLAMSNLRAALDPHIVLFATTSANRDSLYASVPAGTVVSSTTSQTVWQKSATGWNTLYSDTGWISLSSASWGADFSDNGSYYRVVNGIAYIELRAIYNGANVGGSGGDGNIANMTMLNVPAAIRPVRSGAHIPFTYEYGAAYGQGTIYQSTSGMSIGAANPNYAITTGVSIYASATYSVN